jgi:hypothetical protein
MSTRARVLLSCVVLVGAGFGGAAHAQFLDLDVKASHSAYAAGMPQNFVTAGAQSNGQPTAFGGGVPVTNWSLQGVFLSGAPANGVVLAQTDSINQFLAQQPNVQLIPGMAARSSELRIKIESITDTDAIAEINTDFDIVDECRINRGFNDRTGLPLNTVVSPCDAIDATLRLNGVSFQLTGGENQVPLTLTIPEVGYSFTGAPTSPRDPTGADPFIRRGDAIRAIRDNFYASGKAEIVTARLLGQPDNFVLPKGTLPQDGDLVVGEVTVGSTTKRFAVDNPGQVLAYAIANRGAQPADFGLNYTGDCFRAAPGGAVSGACSDIRASVKIAGVEVTAQAAPNSPDVTFAAPTLDLSFTSANALDRDDALNQFADYAAANVDNADLTRAYARYLAQTNPADPLVGNPYSAQGQLTRASLDLDTPSDALGETDGKGSGRGRADDPSGWMVGGRAGYLSAAGQGAEFVDAVIERGFRFREGSRARLKLSLPVSYIHYGGRLDGGETGTVALRAAYEQPLIEGRWVIEPSAAVSAFYSSNDVSSGALYAFGVSSRFKIAPVGRGHIVIGNAIGYSSTLEIEAGSFASPKIANTAVRNGIAYQVPYGRVLGRQGTVRASYTYTHLFGDDVLVEDYHEVSLSYGVASREAAVKQIGETLRLGLSGAFGHDFTAVSLTAGYRF